MAKLKECKLTKSNKNCNSYNKNRKRGKTRERWMHAVEGDSNAMRIKKKQAKVRGRLKWCNILLTTKTREGK
jgi:hypothetical protein